MSEPVVHTDAARPRLEGLTAVVLAGGRGTRLAPFIDNVPKPLVAVRGQPFLYWVTSWLIGQGLRDIVFSVGYLGEQIEKWVADLRLPRDILASCRREESPLGTGGAILACLDVCEDSVLVVNADTLLLAELRPIVARFQTEGLDGLIIGVAVADAARFGTLELGDNGMLRSFREKQPGSGIINGGVCILTRAALERFLPVRQMSFEHELLPTLLSSGARIGVAALDIPFIDIGVPETLAMADAFVTTHFSSAHGLPE